jgi:predicted TPR repeat methyltransferase
LAELQDMTGDTANALKNYKRVLELNPGNKNAATQVKRLEGSK